MRLLATVVSTMIAGASVVVPSSPAAAQETRPRYREYVALGDSWTAGPLVSLPSTKFVTFDCAQSTTNYPHQVAKALGVRTFRDASCSAASTIHFTTSQTAEVGGVNRPQFRSLSRTTDLVTVGIGGNDIGLADALYGCLNLFPADILGLSAPLGRPCTETFTAGGTDVFRKAIRVAEPKIAKAMRQIHRRSPRADIFLVNYLNGVPADGKGCWPIVPITDRDTAYLQKTFLRLNAMLRRIASADPHVRLIDTYTPTVGHDWCKIGKDQYAAGLLPLSLSNPLLAAFPFHPTRAGTDAQARIVTRAIRKAR